MSQLTWRDTETPRFNGVADNIRNFTELLGNSFKAARTGLNDFQNFNEDKASAALAANMLQFRDAKAATDALVSGDALNGVNKSFLTSRALADAAKRPADLLANESQDISNQTNRATMDWTAKTRERELTQQANRDAAAPWAHKFAVASYNKDAKGISDILSNPEAMGALDKLTAKDFSDVITGGQDIQTTGLNQDQTRLNMQDQTQRMSQSKTEFDWKTLDHDNQILAANTIRDSLSGIAGPDDVARFLNSDAAKKLPGQVFMAVKQTLEGMYGSGDKAGDGSTSFDPSGPPADTSRVMNYEARASGFNSVPDSVKTMGDASDFALTVNQANMKRMGKPGSSAMGTFQIVGDTMRHYAPLVLGKDWRNAEFNFENQNKIAERIFNDSKGSNAAIRAQWTSLKGLSDAKVAELRGMSWEQARQVIAQKESGGLPDVHDVRQASRGTVTGLSLASMTEPQRNMARNIAAVANINMSLPDAVNQLTGEKNDKIPFSGVLKGATADEVANQISRIQRQYKIADPGVAAAVLANSLKSTQEAGYFEKYGRSILGDTVGRKLGAQAALGNYYVNSDLERNNAKLLTSPDGLGNLLNAVSNDQNNAEAQMEIAAAQQGYEKARQVYQQRLALVQSGAKSESILAAPLAAMHMYEAQLGKNIGRGRGITDGSLNRNFPQKNDSPPPPPRRAPAPVGRTGNSFVMPVASGGAAKFREMFGATQFDGRPWRR